MAYSIRSHLGSFWLLSATGLGIVLSGCKPADEAPRQQPEQQVNDLQTWLNKGGTIRRSGQHQAPPIVFPDFDALAVEAADVAEDTTEDALIPADASPEEALLLTLSAQPSSEAREHARTLNKSGTDALRKLDFERAIHEFRGALEVYPGHPFARYNLVEALALAKRTEEALVEIETLALVARFDQAAQDRLAAARIDNDLELLRQEPRFRQATLATDILLTWYPESAEAAQSELRALHKRLREGRWLSQLSATPWTDFQALPGIYVLVSKDSDEVTVKAADLIVSLLREQGVTLSLHRDLALPEDAPPLVLLWVGQTPLEGTEENPDAPLGVDNPLAAPDADTDVPGAVPQEALGDLVTPEDLTRLYERPLLRQNDNGSTERLELRSSGFFTWTIAHAGVETRRSGRFTVQTGVLSLDYRERRTDVEGSITEDNGLKRELRMHWPAQGSHESLVLDGLRYDSES